MAPLLRNALILLAAPLLLGMTRPGSSARPIASSIDLGRPASPATSTGHTRCHGISGFLTDADPAGRIIRAGPSRDAVEIGRIPAPRYSEEFDEDQPFEFRIVGSENGWLEIEDIEIFDDGPRQPRLNIAGRGWIAGGGVLVIVQSYTGFAEPSHEAPVLIDGHPESPVEVFGPRRVVACSGRWILADWETVRRDGPSVWNLAYRPEAVVRRDPVIVRAWVAGICNVFETTCDGINGDFANTSGLDLPG